VKKTGNPRGVWYGNVSDTNIKVTSLL
jgi:hypothetical protein